MLPCSGFVHFNSSEILPPNPMKSNIHAGMATWLVARRNKKRHILLPHPAYRYFPAAGTFAGYACLSYISFVVDIYNFTV